MYVTAFWAVLLLASFRQKNKTKFLLGIFMVLAFFVYLSHALYFHQQNYNFKMFGPVYTFSSLSVYPFYYWYIRTLTIDIKIKLKNLLFLLPAFVFACAEYLVYQLMDASESLNFFHGFVHQKALISSPGLLFQVQKNIYIFSRIVFALQIIVFMVAGHRLVVRYNKKIANFYSDLQSRSLNWVKLLLYSIILTSIASSVFNVLGRAAFENSAYLLLFPSLIFSILLFLIGFQGFMQNHNIVDLEKDQEVQNEVNIKDYAHNHLKDKLIKLFVKEQLYKQSDLKITHVCKHLNTNRTYVSSLINKDFNCTFVEFVNSYRIEEAKKLLADLSLKNYSLNYISELSGFGSLNTFIRIFKQKEGITPGRFRGQTYYSGLKTILLEYKIRKTIPALRDGYSILSIIEKSGLLV